MKRVNGINDRLILMNIYNKLKKQEYFFLRKYREISRILIQENDVDIDYDNLRINYSIKISNKFYMQGFLDYYAYGEYWALNKEDL